MSRYATLSRPAIIRREFEGLPMHSASCTRWCDCNEVVLGQRWAPFAEIGAKRINLPTLRLPFILAGRLPEVLPNRLPVQVQPASDLAHAQTVMMQLLYLHKSLQSQHPNPLGSECLASASTGEFSSGESEEFYGNADKWRRAGVGVAAP